ncbi:unnamed protein product, partial [Amoebophrya sp. A25]
DDADYTNTGTNPDACGCVASSTADTKGDTTSTIDNDGAVLGNLNTSMNKARTASCSSSGSKSSSNTTATTSSNIMQPPAVPVPPPVPVPPAPVSTPSLNNKSNRKNHYSYFNAEQQAQQA